MLASTAPKALLKSRCPATPITSAAEAEHPRFVIPTPNGGNLVRSFTAASVAEHVVYAELFGVAHSSAAFGVGMTRTIEGDPESFSANVSAALSLLLLRLGLEPSPFKT